LDEDDRDGEFGEEDAEGFILREVDHRGVVEGNYLFGGINKARGWG
jgi:hypothetical protein